MTNVASVPVSRRKNVGTSRRAGLLTAVSFAVVAAPLFAAFSGTDVFLPSVGRAAGISNWYTTVWVHNPGTVQATAQFTFLVRDQVNTSATAVTRTIAAGATVKYANAMTEIFGREGFGAIRVMSNQKLVVNSRIYARATSETDTSSKGQFFAGVPASFAIGTGQKSQLLGVFQSQPSASSAFRYNFGFVETTGQDCTVRVTPRSPTGAVLATGKSYPVRRLEQRQFQFKDEFASLSTDNARLEVEVTAGNGRVIAFGSGIANGSSDPSTFEMSFRDDLLAENASGSGTITGVTAGNGLTGGGTSGSVTLNVGAGAGISVTPDGVALADAGVTKSKLAASGGLAGQVLAFDGSNLVWQTPSGGGGGGDITGVAAGAGLAGGGTSGDVTLAIANGGVGTNQLADGAVSKRKLAASGGGTSGQILSTDGTSLFWQDDGLTFPVLGTCSTTNPCLTVENWDPNGFGVWGEAGIFGVGVVGVATGGGVSPIPGTGVIGRGSTGPGVYAQSESGDGVLGESPAGYGVHGVSGNGDGVFGQASAGGKSGVYAVNDNPAGYAAYMRGNASVTGTLTKGGGAFRIDHPLDPENKVLQHSFVESPDMMNFYNGNVVTDALGEAVVELPAYFEALNRDFRYQLTVIGEFAQAIVAQKVAEGRFVIRTDRPDIEVSWQITGIRRDPWAEANRIVVEQDKPDAERGLYLHPAAFGQPPERDVETVRHPDVVTQQLALPMP